MRKVILFLLMVLVVLSVLVACRGPEDSVDPPAVDPPSEPEAPTELTLFADGVTEYTIVYDDADPIITEVAEELQRMLKRGYSLKIEAKPASQVPEKSGKEIVIGNIRPAAKTAQKELKREDFCIRMVGEDLVLLSTGSRMYYYLYDVLYDEVISKLKSEDWTFKAEQNVTYSSSKYKDVNYIERMKQENGWNSVESIRTRMLEEIFSYRTYEATNGTSLPYRLYLPYHYDERNEYPVIVLLHGAGERGVDNSLQLLHVLPDWFAMENTPFADAIIIVPQCPDGQQWVDTPWTTPTYSIERVKESNELVAVVELLDEIGYEYSTDWNRYYVTGLSMGGFGTWDLISRHTDLFAAAVPICGGVDLDCAEKLSEFPIYTVHGTADPTVPVSGTAQMVEALRAAGNETVYYDALEGEGHGVWGYAAQKRSIWEWMLEQSRSNR